MRSHRLHGVIAGALGSTLVLLAVACGDSEREALTEDPDASPADRDAASSLEPDAADGGTSGFDAAPEPVSCAVTPCALELAAGARHVCARMAGGDVRCWGDNTHGSIGNGISEDDGTEPGDTTRPVTVVDLTGATQLSAARDTTCARRDDGSVRCWGQNDHGQLGLGIADELAHPRPTAAPLSGGAMRVDLGRRSACAVLTTGELWCWGSNDKKQLARSERDPVLGPGRAELAGSSVTRAAASDGTTYGISSSGRLLAWGALAGREGSLDPDPVPAPLPALAAVHDVAVGESHACAIAGGRVSCWGSSTSYALCTGLPSPEPVPAHAVIVTTAYPQQIAVSRNTTCVRLTNGQIHCCGAGSSGQLGVPTVDGGLSSSAAFAPASSFTGYAVQVVTTDLATCALLRSGAVECWGGNAHGELGRGTRDGDPHPAPAAVSFP
ncbi:MAG: hypothetical protein KF795_15890 [Labilithrix sp.]|nr:hypothetical protein [Labilithrix sp.]